MFTLQATLRCGSLIALLVNLSVEPPQALPVVVVVVKDAHDGCQCRLLLCPQLLGHPFGRSGHPAMMVDYDS